MDTFYSTVGPEIRIILESSFLIDDERYYVDFCSSYFFEPLKDDESVTEFGRIIVES